MRVLLVDDDERLLRAWSRRLTAHTVSQATSLSVARRLCGTRNFDVVVVDLWLGLECALDFIPEVKSCSPSCRVILASAQLSDRYAREASAAGADLAIDKPRDLKPIIDGAWPQRDERIYSTLYEAEGRQIAEALRECGNNITHAAARLEVRRSTLQRKLTKRGWRA